MFLCFLTVLLFALGLTTSPNAAEAMPVPPFTTPIIHTQHPDTWDPVTGWLQKVFPASLVISVDEKAILLGNLSRAPVIYPASVSITFDVQNPGLDFTFHYSTEDFPLLQDQYGGIWRTKHPLVVDFAKQETRFLYSMDPTAITSYQSHSEQMTILKGTMTEDAECEISKACCKLNDTHYSEYQLVDSPVPPYQCSGAPIHYTDPEYQFATEIALGIGEMQLGDRCIYSFSGSTGFIPGICTSNERLASVPSIKPTFQMPSSGYALCRKGESLADTTYSDTPFPVVGYSFCSRKRCIGYTAENYMNDRKACGEFPLGYYTSADGNNTNQFSLAESQADGMLQYVFLGCKWMNIPTISPSNELTSISLKCDVPQSNDWAFTYNIPYDTLQQDFLPQFPIGKGLRAIARVSSNPLMHTARAMVQYVPLAPAPPGTFWTVRACIFLGGLDYGCTDTKVAPAAAAGSTPQTLEGSAVFMEVHWNMIHDDPSMISLFSVVISAECKTTPGRSPFRVLLPPTEVPLLPVLRTDVLPDPTLFMHLAREPLQRMPKPEEGPFVCEGDFRYSMSVQRCRPFDYTQCRALYHNLRDFFDQKQKRCMSAYKVATKPPQYQALPLPEPVSPLTPAEVEALLEAVQLPVFMKPMKQVFAELDNMPFPDVASKEGAAITRLDPQQEKSGRGMTQGDTSSSNSGSEDEDDEEEETKGITEPYTYFTRAGICTVVFSALTLIIWIFILCRDLIQACCGCGPWGEEKRRQRRAWESRGTRMLMSPPFLPQTPSAPEARRAEAQWQQQEEAQARAEYERLVAPHEAYILEQLRLQQQQQQQEYQRQQQRQWQQQQQQQRQQQQQQQRQQQQQQRQQARQREKQEERARQQQKEQRRQQRHEARQRQREEEELAHQQQQRRQEVHRQQQEYQKQQQEQWARQQQQQEQAYQQQQYQFTQFAQGTWYVPSQGTQQQEPYHTPYGDTPRNYNATAHNTAAENFYTAAQEQQRMYEAYVDLLVRLQDQEAAGGGAEPYSPATPARVSSRVEVLESSDKES